MVPGAQICQCLGKNVANSAMLGKTHPGNDIFETCFWNSQEIIAPNLSMMR